VTQDNRIPNFWWCPTHHLYRGGDKRPCADAVRLVPAPPAPRVLGPEHTYALSVARSAVLKAAGKFVTAADMYRKRDLLRSVQEMADSERACVRVASFLADEIASARATSERAIPEPTEGQNHG
jgi:hypothetical protein